MEKEQTPRENAL